MKKLGKILALVLSLVLMFSTFAGCGTKSTEGQATSEPQTTATPEPQGDSEKKPVIGSELKYDPNVPVNNGKDITIKFWLPEDVKSICEKYVAKYEEMHPNVKFDLNISPWDDYWTKLPIAIQGGTGPDIFWMHNAYTDVMVPITEPLPESIFPLDVLRKDFRQVDLHLIDGKLYYIDMGLMSSVIMYNKQMWREAGLSETDYPKTWDELREAAKKLTKYDDAGNIVVSGFSFNGDVNFAFLVMAMNYQKGQFAFSEDGKSSIFNNPITIENMEYLRSWYTEHKIGDNKGAVNREALGQGKTAMICDWTWIPNYIKTTFPDVEIGCFPTPSFDGNPAAFDRNNGEATPCVSAKASAEAKAVAFDFLKYLLANDEFILEFVLFNGVFPAKYSLDNAPEILESPVHQALAKTIDKTIWPGPIPAAVEQAMKSYLQDDFLMNNVSAEDAVKKVDEVLAKDLANLSFMPVERRYQGAERFKK